MPKICFILIALLALPRNTFAVKVADITRISGQRTNVLTGLGLVVGLKGTGDGGDFSPAIKPLASMLKKFSDSATVTELANVANVALVSVTATVPKDGVREGDKIDAYITSLGAATSLKGGRLFITPLLGPTGDLAPQGLPFAMCEGPVDLEDPSTPTV